MFSGEVVPTVQVTVRALPPSPPLFSHLPSPLLLFPSPLQLMTPRNGTQGTRVLPEEGQGWESKIPPFSHPSSRNEGAHYSIIIKPNY